MKILVEAMCADYGGIATYVDNLLRVWLSVFPDDELHVIVPQGSRCPRAPGVSYREVRVARPVALGRPLAQTREVRRAVREVEPDAVLATLPSTTLLHPRVPMAVVVYDLRHELRPEQFSPARRVLRRLSYGRGYAVADGFVAISQRTLDDLHDLHRGTRNRPGCVTHLAADHVQYWPTAQRGEYALAFGHHTNKNVDMIVEAWALLARSRADLPRLRIVGLASGAREAIRSQATTAGIGELVELMPFLPDEDFRSCMAGAGLVVFPSDFEGFGLPVVEAMWLGIPVVVGPDRAVLEVAAGHAAVMSAWTSAALAQAVGRALDFDDENIAAAREHAHTFTWSRTVELTRAALAEITPAAAAR